MQVKSGAGEFEISVERVEVRGTMLVLTCSAALALALRAAVAAVRMQPAWAVLVGFETAVDVAFDGAFVVDSPLAWVARNNSKPGRPPPECWVLHATPEWSRPALEIDLPTAENKLRYVPPTGANRCPQKQSHI